MVSTLTTLVVGFVVGVATWAMFLYIRNRNWNVHGEDDEKRKSTNQAGPPVEPTTTREDDHEEPR